MLKQSKLASLIEVIISTVIGLVIAFSATQFFLPTVLHLQITPTQNVLYSAFMTVVSVARGYVVRRAANSEFWKAWGAEPFDAGEDDTEVDSGVADVRIDISGHQFTPKNFEHVQQALREAIKADEESRERRRTGRFVKWSEFTSV